MRMLAQTPILPRFLLPVRSMTFCCIQQPNFPIKWRTVISFRISRVFFAIFLCIHAENATILL